MFSWKSIRSASRRLRGKRGTRELNLEPLESRTLLSVSPNLIDLNPYGASSPEEFVQVGDVAYFTADDGDHGRELWVTDGTSDGTLMVKDIRAGVDSSEPTELTEFNGELFFIADDGVNGQELWKTDGTTTGTVMVHDIHSGEGYQYPYGDGPLQSFPRDLTVSNGKLFFGAEDSANGSELWMTDGTSSGTVLVKDIHEGSFTDDYGTYPNSSNPLELVDVNGTLFFTADDGVNGRELWKSDGTSAGTLLVKDVYSGTYPYYYNNYYYGQYPNASYPEKLTAVDGQLFFLAEDDTHGLELWKSDGTSSGTELVEDIAAGTASAFTEDSLLLAIGNELFLTANDGFYGDEIWISDGTANGTELLKDINPGSAGNVSYYGGFTAVGETLFFSADDGYNGKELWKSDGTESGTVLVADINPGTDSYGYPSASFPFYMAEVDGTLYFSASDGVAGRELWMSDGTEEGTVLVHDAIAESGGLYLTSLEAVNGYLVFSGEADYERELWSFDLANIGSNTAQLTIYVDSENVTIPSNVGVESSGDTTAVYTTDSSGTLILDSAATLGNFFETWRTDAGQAGNNANATFSADELLGNAADTTNTVQMFVNGEISTAFDDYTLQDGDQVVLVFGSNPVLSLNTNYGPIVLELFEEATPGTVDNFLNYVNDGDYIDSFFHRSVTDFVIQGGGFKTTSTTFTSVSQFYDVPTDGTIDNEPGISNLRGTVAMAKLGGDPDSATSQFFVNLSDDNTFLDTADYDYFTVFGQVLDMTTADEIASLPIDNSNASPYGELPLGSGDQLVVVQDIGGQGEVAGLKFLDANANGVYDSGDSALSGVSVYVDANANGALDSGEIWTTTDENGAYLLQLEPGIHTIRADVSAGRITTLPTSDGCTVTVEIGREIADVDFGEATLSAPASVSLAAAYDTGIADNDDVTRLSNTSSETALQFLVEGVIAGAEVSVYSDGALIGTATASGESVTVLTDGLTALADGLRSITSVQRFNGGTSEPSTALAVTVDTTAPAGLDTLPPDFPQVYVPYEFDAQSAEEGQEGFRYSLVDAPSGMSIDVESGVISWTPALEQAVPQDFEIDITDRAGNVTSQTVEMTVLGVIPAYPDEYSTDEDTILTIDVTSGVLSNDGDEDSGELTAVLVDQATNGSVTFNDDGSFVYTPDENYFGTDNFTYKASDGSDDTNVARVTITVNNVNDVPEPVADSYSTLEDVALTVEAATGVLVNDVDVDGDVLTASLVDQATNGTVTLNSDGSFTYVPDDEFSGSDSFTYVVSDGLAQSEAITVSLTIENVPDPPTAVSDAYSVAEDSTLIVDLAAGILANDTDPDSETLTVSVSANPSSGTLALNSDGSFTYVPNTDFNGTDSFTYVASDGTNTSAEASVTITVNNVADPPTATDDTATVSNDGTSVLVDVLANDTSAPDPDQTLTIISVTQGAVGGTVAIEGDSIRYTAPSGVTGQDTFTYTIQDTDGLTDTATVTVSIEGLISPDDSGTDSSGDNCLSGYVFIDADGDGIRDAGEYGVPGVQVTLTGTDTAGNAVNRTSLSQGDGSYLFDGLASGTYQLTERQPMAMADSLDSTTVPDAVLGNDQITNIVLDGGDVYAENNFGELGLYAEYVSITMFFASAPAPEQCLLDTVIYAEELAGNTELADAIRSGEIDFETESTSAPVASADAYSTTENTVLTINASSGVLVNDLDSDGDSLAATIVTPASNGSIALSADGSFVYAPGDGFFGTDTFTYRAYDGQNLSNTVTVTITVADSNAAPTSLGDSYSVNEDAILTIDSATGVLTNDSDPDGDTLSATMVSGPANGTLLLNTDGSFSYTPNAEFYGTDTFTYQAGDGSLSSATSTVTITVADVNDAPTASDDAYSVDENATLSIDSASGVLANDSDADGDDLTAGVVGSPSHGTLSLSADGSFTYVPNAGYSGTDSFTYEANDGASDSNQATVSIAVADVNDAPVGVNDTYSVDEDTVLAVDAVFGVLGNDTDADGDPLTATLVDLPAHGDITLNSDGSFTYTPEIDFAGSDSFTYTASDGFSDSELSTVSLSVADVDDPAAIVLPVEFIDSANVAQRSVGETIEFTVKAEDIDDETPVFQLDLESSGIPDGAALPTIDSSSGAFQWTPTATGAFEICVIVINEGGEANQESFPLEVISGD
jgi:ELWxxDGT repeat protein/VCBS repeat-containing protein